MSLGQIKRKLEKKSYGTISEVAGDLTIMFENAKKYNITTSKLYKVRNNLLNVNCLQPSCFNILGIILINYGKILKSI